jgi:transposase
MKALVRREGLRLASGPTGRILERLAAVEVPEMLALELAPLVSLLKPLNEQIAAADARIAALAEGDPVVNLLMSAPGVGPVTATAFVSILDDVKRFANAHQVEAYLGLVPTEASSGEKQCRGSITKAGNARMRWLLVEAAWGVLRTRRADTAELRAWAMRVAQRRGKRTAVVALARRLAGILYAMWRDNTRYSAKRVPTREVLMSAA